MKRLSITLLLALFVFGCVSAQQIFYRDQATVLWDAVTMDAQGDPFLPTDTVTYEVFVYDDVLGVTNDQNAS